MADLNKIMEELSELSVLEAAELVEMLEEKWGVSAAAPVAVAAVGGAAGGEEAAEAKTEFDIVIKDIGPKKIQVIKAVRQLTSLGLKDAKEIAEAPNAKIMEGVGKEAAEEAKALLEEAGAVIELA